MLAVVDVDVFDDVVFVVNDIILVIVTVVVSFLMKSLRCLQSIIKFTDFTPVIRQGRSMSRVSLPFNCCFQIRRRRIFSKNLSSRQI